MVSNDNNGGRLDYRSTLVSPDGYLVVCPACDDRHEAESLTAYECPTCGEPISVTL